MLVSDRRIKYTLLEKKTLYLTRYIGLNMELLLSFNIL